ncbi:hypothetical protein PoB_006603100 [Plakobranchus ocellatus]|uniref:Uncharacterized protein n=1 Tax=Plakobranchus ocellatus TaxID=259542 RepID=A0AAV4D6F4_9GAST|nr:hypothetical protein PoB_006603100 [Plakobranchus ocellatus]
MKTLVMPLAPPPGKGYASQGLISWFNISVYNKVISGFRASLKLRGTGGGAQTCDRMGPADLRADSLSPQQSGLRFSDLHQARATVAGRARTRDDKDPCRFHGRFTIH